MKFTFLAFALAGLGTAAHAGIADQLPPEAYIKLADQELARSGKGIPCSYEEVVNGTKAIASIPTSSCVKMLPEQRFVGLWRAAFEGSRFCPAPSKTCDNETPGELIWLSNTPGRPHGGLYRVEFFGRRTMYKGPYGHFGAFDHEVDIDRLVSLKELEEPPSDGRRRRSFSNGSRARQRTPASPIGMDSTR